MLQRMMSVAFATVLVAMLASAVMADVPKTPGEKALRAATDAADSTAIQAALDQIDAERHGGAPPAAKPTTAITPKETPAPAKPEVSITSEPSPEAPYSVDLHRLPRNRREGTRQLYHDLKDSGHTMTAKELKDWARGLFYSRDQADATTISLSGRVRALERKVDGMKPVQTAPPAAMPGANTDAAKPAAARPSEDAAKRHIPLWALLLLAAALILALLVVVGRRRGWSPLRWTRNRANDVRIWWSTRRRGRRRPRVFRHDGTDASPEEAKQIEPAPQPAPMPAGPPADNVINVPEETTGV